MLTLFKWPYLTKNVKVTKKKEDDYMYVQISGRAVKEKKRMEEHKKSRIINKLFEGGIHRLSACPTSSPAGRCSICAM